MENIEIIIDNLCNDSGFDRETARMVLDIYFKQTNELMIEVRSLLKQPTDSDYSKVENLMHKLKGSSGNVRVMTVMNLSVLAEEKASNRDLEGLRDLLDQIEKQMSTFI